MVARRGLLLLPLLALLAAPLHAAPPKKDSREALRAFSRWWKTQHKAYKKTRDVDERVAIVRSLGERDEIVAGQMLTVFLHEPHAVPVRIAAAQQLALPRHKVHMTRILAGLDKARGELELRVEIIHTLGEIGDKGAVDELAKLLQRTNFVQVRQTLVALRKINANECVRPVVRYALAVLPPKSIRGQRAATKDRFDWDRYDEVHRTVLETLEGLTKVRWDTHEEWRSWYNENKDNYK